MLKPQRVNFDELGVFKISFEHPERSTAHDMYSLP